MQENLIRPAFGTCRNAFLFLTFHSRFVEFFMIGSLQYSNSQLKKKRERDKLIMTYLFTKDSSTFFSDRRSFSPPFQKDFMFTFTYNCSLPVHILTI